MEKKITKKTNSKLSKEESNARKEIIDRMLVIMDFKPDAKFPTSFTKKLTELKQSYTYVEINYTILKLHDNLLWAVNNKEFKTDYNKITYLMAIIQNNINKYYKELKEINKTQEIKENNILDTELSIINTERVIKQPKRMDMSEFLD